MRSAMVELASGLWVGHYAQRGTRSSQRMVLEFADGLLRGDGIDDIGPFNIDGEYRVVGDEVRLGWVKTYEEAHSVMYLGVLRQGRITGRWDIGGFGDQFELSFSPEEVA
jgi:hypothetical protein